jgi:hypothetical protein
MDVEEMITQVRKSTYAKDRCLPLKVFVSSTFLDLRSERQAVKKAIERCGCVPILAEDAETIPGKTLLEQISYWLSKTQVLVILVAERYGEHETSKVSWTQQEVKAAA